MPGSPSESGSSDSLSPDDAFGLLGNKTRVDILQALWDTFESGSSGNALSYSDLFERVEIQDSGNFSYHLEKLTGAFVRHTDEGYELKQPGINVMRAVVSGTVTNDLTFGPVTVDVCCPLCDAPVEFVYADELMIVSCTACPGRSRWKNESGHLFGAFVPPIGIDQHSVEDAFRVAIAYSLHETALFHHGVCPHCLGPVETTIDTCSNHDAGESGRCPTCDRFNLADAWLVCSTCKRSIPPPVALVALAHPIVTAFLHDHGVEHKFATWETVALSYWVDEELVSEEPLRVACRIPAGGDELELVLDGDLNVVDMTRSGTSSGDRPP